MVKFEVEQSVSQLVTGQRVEHCAVDGWSSLSAQDTSLGITDLPGEFDGGQACQLQPWWLDKYN